MGYRAVTLPTQTAQHLADLTADEFRIIATRSYDRYGWSRWDYTFSDPAETFKDLRDDEKIVVHHLADQSRTVLVARLARTAVSTGRKNSRGRR